jgi:hypothetical protein
MAYTAVPTVATGDTWTAANHNTYIRDNFAAGVPDAFTTKGDLFVGTGADAGSRLGVGANDTELVADSSQATGCKWATPAHNAASAAVHGLPSGANVLGNKSAAGEFVQRGINTAGGGSTNSGNYVHYSASATITFAVAFSSSPVVVAVAVAVSSIGASCINSVSTIGFNAATLGPVGVANQGVSWIALGA